MENIKWLKRKYPNSFEKLNEYFDRHELQNFKQSNLKIGYLNKDIIQCQKYKKGSIIQFRNTNPVNDYNYPNVLCIVKCQLGFTESGYHSFWITKEDYEELKN